LVEHVHVIGPDRLRVLASSTAAAALVAEPAWIHTPDWNTVDAHAPAPPLDC
jgi:hypothetical protein